MLRNIIETAKEIIIIIIIIIITITVTIIIIAQWFLDV